MPPVHRKFFTVCGAIVATAPLCAFAESVVIGDGRVKTDAGVLGRAVDLLRDGTPPLQKHSPPAPHRRDVSYLAFFSVFCPAFCPGLSRARYDSPSMTRS
jgi:hypothetical protein